MTGWRIRHQADVPDRGAADGKPTCSDFDGDLYGQYLMVELISYIRPEAKFDGVPALVAQIGRMP